MASIVRPLTFRDSRTASDAVVEHRPAVHPEVHAAGVDVFLGDVLGAAQRAARRRGVKGLGACAVGVKDGREDAFATVSRRPHDDRPCPVAQKNGDVAPVVRPVNPRREDLGTRDQHVVVRARPDEVVGDSQPV